MIVGLVKVPGNFLCAISGNRESRRATADHFSGMLKFWLRVELYADHIAVGSQVYFLKGLT